VKDGMTIHSSPQMEWNQVSVYDWLQCVGGHQQLLALDGYQIPLNMHHGLAYMDMCPFIDDTFLLDIPCGIICFALYILF
jgi:hypothetical protein